MFLAAGISALLSVAISRSVFFKTQGCVSDEGRSKVYLTNSHCGWMIVLLVGFAQKSKRVEYGGGS